MAVKRGGLGRGLDALIPNKNASASKDATDEKPKKKAKSAAKAESKSSAKEDVKATAKADTKASTKTDTKVEAKTDTKAATKPETKTVVKQETKTAAKAAPKPAAKAETKPAVKSAAKPAAKAETKPAVKPAQETAVKPEVISDANQAVSAVSATPTASDPDHVVMMKISQVEPNRNQPRKEFDKEKLEELAESIRQYGVIQPLLVQKSDGYYEIIAGERRWRASKIAGLKEVPVIVRDYSEQEVVEISLIENIQREDLNPIEEANAYVRLMDEFHLTQEKIAERVSKSRAAVTNAIRLLRLPEEVRTMLVYGDLSEGHARAILGLQAADQQIEAARKVAQGGLSVRETEKLVRLMQNPPVKKVKTPDVQTDLIYRSLEDQMKSILGTKVAISRKDKNKGKIEIEYYSSAELERILDLFRSIGRQEEY